MVYDSIGGNTDRSVVFIVLDESGDVFSSTVSKSSIPADKTGYTFILDDYVAEQISKLTVKDGNLVLIYGEELIPPVKSEKELKREALLRQIAELDAAEDEPVNTEEQTNVSLLDYTEESSE